MQGARRAHAPGESVQVQGIAQALLQFLQGRIDRLFEPRSRLAGGRGQGHAQALGLRIDRGQQCQQGVRRYRSCPCPARR